MTGHVVATVDEIPPGSRKIVEVAGREIGVFNVGGYFYAVRNRCPHQAGPLCEGRLAGVLRSSAPGEYRVEREGEILRCPWHQWEFDLPTGQSWFDPARVRVRAYQTRIEPGTALAAETEEANGAPAGGATGATGDTGPSGWRPGPYAAETYSVSVEHHYVLVELSR